jgi:hypothetical protein
MGQMVATDQIFDRTAAVGLDRDTDGDLHAQ